MTTRTTGRIKQLPLVGIATLRSRQSALRPLHQPTETPRLLQTLDLPIRLCWSPSCFFLNTSCTFCNYEMQCGMHLPCSPVLNFILFSTHCLCEIGFLHSLPKDWGISTWFHVLPSSYSETIVCHFPPLSCYMSKKELGVQLVMMLCETYELTTSLIPMSIVTAVHTKPSCNLSQCFTYSWQSGLCETYELH